LTDEKEIARTLENFKHADWYGDEYKEGEYIKGLVMKVDPAADGVDVGLAATRLLYGRATWAAAAAVQRTS
jgi:hypothetical protein